MAKVMVSGWVAKTTVQRSDLLKVLLIESVWDGQKKQRQRRFWMVECWGRQVRLEPYLTEGTFVSAGGDFDFNQAPDGKVWLHRRAGELVMGPKRHARSVRLDEGPRGLSPRGGVAEGPRADVPEDDYLEEMFVD